MWESSGTDGDTFERLERIRDNIGNTGWRRWWHSAQWNMLVARLERAITDTSAVFGGTQLASSPMRQRIKNTCVRLLEDASSCLKGKIQASRFWGLVHACEETLILIMSPAMLAAKAVEIRSKFGSRVRDPSLRREWLESGLLNDIANALRTRAEGTKTIDAPLASTGGALTVDPEAMASEQGLREKLQVALKEINQVTDNGFWYLNASVAVKIWSGVTLVACFGLAILWQWLRSISPISVSWACVGLPCDNTPLPLLSTLMLGAAGASLSNLVTSGTVVMAIGSTTRHYLYYVFVKPVVGALAALLVLMLEQSGAVFQFVPGNPANHSNLAPVLIQVRDDPFAAGAAYVVLALVAGFAAERVVRSTVDAMLQRVFAKAEKIVKSPEGHSQQS